MEMLRLNMSHRLPTIGLKIQHSSVDDSHMVPAELHTENRQARSNKGATQPRIDINSYPSRKSYGFKNMTDFTRERGQKGISDVQSSTSSHAQETWSIIDNAAKKSNYVHDKAEQSIYSESKKRRTLVAEFIPNPQITLAEPSRVEGESDLGDVTVSIDAKSYASIKTTRGSAETYIQDKGFLHRWITQGKYDMYV